MSSVEQGMMLHRQGRLAEAEAVYRAALAREPGRFEALHLLAALRYQQGAIEEAHALIEKAVALKPRSAPALSVLVAVLLARGEFERALAVCKRILDLTPGDIAALHNRAVALLRLSRFEEAFAACDAVLAREAGFVPALFERGNALARLARFEEALASYGKVLARAPVQAAVHIDALVNRGNALLKLGRPGDALAGYDKALAVNSSHLDALVNRAIALKELKRHDEALESCARALALDPRHVGALTTQGNIHSALERNAEALVSYERALAENPADAEILNNRSIALLALQRPEDALESAGRALAIDPRNASSYLRRGNALAALNRHEAAVADYKTAIARGLDDADSYYNLGIALHDMGRNDEAFAHFTRALALKPDHPDAGWNASVACLCTGRFKEGWELYEHRWARHIRGTPPRDYPQPRWNGEYVHGVLLVWGEQGPGDQILYASMVPELVEHADTVVIEAEPRLASLFARSFPGVQVIAYRPELYSGRIDAHLPIGSLPRFLRPGWDAFPRYEQGYLAADADLTKKLRARLSPDGRKIVGLSWISKNSRVGKSKSAELKDFETLLRSPDFRFVDLQYGDTRAEREAVEAAFGVRVERLEDIDNMNDLDGFAALVSACDAVVTVSNTTAHVAGALGRPVWVMPPHGRGRFWYWFEEREDSPWYPHARIRRQRNGQPWAELIAPIGDEIRALGGAR
jgi:tetratricopeptide (TPR) repeat protein